jgi:hypothetical protein
MFNHPPKILSHISSLEDGNFVTPEYILGEGKEREISLFRRFCPHRMYPLADSGDTIIGNIVCKFHNFQWDKLGIPINNNRQISCGTAQVGKSGLIFKDFNEPDHFWVTDLSKETNLRYSHSMHGSSKGSWLWMMEIQADLLHIWKGGIHPELSKVTELNDIEMFDGDGWILQTCSTGWWLFIYPFTFIEWSKGCLSINYTIPKDKNQEFGFDWITQFYYDPIISSDKRKDFETLEDVFHEDVIAIEKQHGPWFPLINKENRLEDHCIHYGKWVVENKSNN